MRLLILATTTGYQTRAFGEAAERLGVELAFATDRCRTLDDPWQDGALPIRFYDEEGSAATILRALERRAIDGLLVVGDRPTMIAARVAEAIGLPWHPPAGAAVARNKQFTRERLRDAGFRVPWFVVSPLESPLPGDPRLTFPCVIKPIALSGSRGVMRADDPRELAAAFERLRALMRLPEVRAERDSAHEIVIVEAFIPGREYAVEGMMNRGKLQVLAIFDKPDPLDGPYFEETIYVTPAASDEAEQRAVARAVAAAAQAIGLYHGPVHAECRVNADGVFVLEVAARPIGGLCARALRFVRSVDTGHETKDKRYETEDSVTLEELLLRHACGEAVEVWRRERLASGVMMIPIPRRGILREVDGVDAARAVPHVEDVRITAKTDQLLMPLPEGASYLGFIFARADSAADVDSALRAAHARLRFAIDPEFPVLGAAGIRYNS